jgi:hypothetical protein
MPHTREGRMSADYEEPMLRNRCDPGGSGRPGAWRTPYRHGHELASRALRTTRIDGTIGHRDATLPPLEREREDVDACEHAISEIGATMSARHSCFPGYRCGARCAARVGDERVGWFLRWLRRRRHSRAGRIAEPDRRFMRWVLRGVS